MEIKISVPTSLSDITLRQYRKYEQVVKANEGDENSERFINLKMVEVFCGITYEQAQGMLLNDFTDIVATLYAMLQETPDLVRTFKIGSKEFGFIPDLEEMTFGEYIDLDTYIHDMDNIEKAMAVLYRPIKYKQGEKYEILKYEGDLMHETMLDTPMSAVVSSTLFFYNLGIDLSNVMMNSSQEAEKAQRRLLQDSEKNGVGINHFTHSLREISDELRKSRI